MYAALVIKNYYLPDINSSAITSEYLLNVALNKYFRIECQEIKIGQLFKKVSKIKLFGELETFCQKRSINLGINVEKLPDKKWLINVLHTIDDQNWIFKNIADTDKVIGLTRDDLNILKQLDTSSKKKNYEVLQKNSAISAREKNQPSQIKTKQYYIHKLQRKRLESEKIVQKIQNYSFKVSELTESQQIHQRDTQSIRKQQKQ